MYGIQIIGNGHSIPLISGWELSGKEKKEFDWMKAVENEWAFFRYRGQVYSLEEFSRPDKNAADWLKSFDGYLSESFFSGVAIKLGDKDGDTDFVRAYTFIS
jgi:hypothetical protein